MFRWILKLWFPILLLGVIFSWLYIGFINAKDSYIIIRSPLQGNKILHPGQWNIIPENIIPNYVKINYLPNTLYLKGKITYHLPYYKLLSHIEDYTILINYSLEYTLTEQDVKDMAQNAYYDIEDFWIKKVENKISSVLDDFIKTLNISEQPLTKAYLLEKINIDNLNIEHLRSPNISEYLAIKSQIIQTIGSEQLASQAALEYLNDLKKEQKKQYLQNMLNLATEYTKNMKEENIDVPTVLSLLDYLLEESDKVKK